MPKISKKSMKIDQGDLSEYIEFNIHYNGELGFYAEIPAHLNEQFDQLTDEELKGFSATRKKKYKYQKSNEDKNVIVSETENGVVQAMRPLVEKLCTMAVTKEAVIIVKFNKQDRDSVWRDDDAKGDLQLVGMDLSAVFCFRVTTGGKNPKFYKYSKRKNFDGEMVTDRREVNLYKHEGIVIPDTPENKKFITDLHGALRTLVGKMVEFTKTSDALLGLIASQQKLITFEPQKTEA